LRKQGSDGKQQTYDAVLVGADRARGACGGVCGVLCATGP
jgi:hypothetical protein